MQYSRMIQGNLSHLSCSIVRVEHAPLLALVLLRLMQLMGLPASAGAAYLYHLVGKILLVTSFRLHWYHLVGVVWY